MVEPDGARRAAALARGEVDGRTTRPAAQLAALAGSRDVRVAYGRSTTAVSIAVTNFEGPLSDVRLRRAFSLAVDRARLARAAPFAGAEPAKAPSARGQWGATPEDRRRWFVNLPPVTYDTEAARRLVVEAGVPERPIVLAAGPDPLSRALAAQVQDSVVLSGLPVVVEQLTAASYTALLADPAAATEVDAYIAVAATAVADPLPFYARFTSRARAGSVEDGGDGEGADVPGIKGFDAPTYDAVSARAAAEGDRAARLQLVDQLQKLAVGSHLWIPIYEHPSVVGERRAITGAPAAFVWRWLPWAALIGASD
jgi:peptide/nickel transport system substrate-binding protein